MESRFNMFDNEIGARFSKRFASASLVIAQSPLPKSTQELAALRVSQINGCGWCIDLHTKEAAAAGETAVRLNLVAAWRHASVFTEAEQAALALAEEGTRLADDAGDALIRQLQDAVAKRRQAGVETRWCAMPEAERLGAWLGRGRVSVLVIGAAPQAEKLEQACAWTRICE